MTVKFELCCDKFNTQYAPLAALLAHYKVTNRLNPLKKVEIKTKTVDFHPIDKLEQFLVSILAGCETVSEMNTKLKSEPTLARVGGWERFADQSTVSRTLDELTLKQIDQLRSASTTIWRSRGATLNHDWRAYLWFDFDLSGLPCGKQAQGAKKGYFSGKKTQEVVN